MKKITIMLSFLLAWQFSMADEGMWLINLITKNIAQMEAQGIKLSAEDIYSINHSSLKDAIVQLDDGSCTSELISAKGLLLTNHHCGIDAIQLHSTPEHNLLKDGFFARNLSEELSIPGKTAMILFSVEDVTSKMVKYQNEKLSSSDYYNGIYAGMDSIARASTQNGKFYAIVKPMFHFNTFYLFLYERFLDVRLVAAPPTSIGNFGGDVDNWHWPRHTGDFSMFRIYTAPDGKPAEYSTKNVPYIPKRFLNISLNGVKEGDFTMIIGYPGTTYRYSSPSEAMQARDVLAPWKDKVWGELIRIIKDAQAKDPKVKVNYTDKHDMLVNFWQKDTWQAESMFRFNVVERLKAREDSLRLWVSQKPSTRAKYLSAMPVLEDYFKTYRENKWVELSGSLDAILGFPVDVNKNINACDELFGAMLSKKNVKKVAKSIKKRIPKIFEKYYINPDVWLYSTSLKSLIDNTSDCPNIPMIQAIKQQPQISQMMPLYAQSFYQRSYFTSPENLKRFLKKPAIDSIVKDPIFMLYQSYHMLYDSISKIIRPRQSDYEKAMQLYTNGLLEMEDNKLHYPDANSTMRLTYGKVIGYKPNDGVICKPFTTLDGLMAKENPKIDVFNVSPRLKQLWQAKDYGRYGVDGILPVCFLTDNDITGGNSGSPTLDANGNLIGIAFDGNNDAMACDYAFEPDIQRTIIVDIRYVLFVIDKYAGAKNLIDEMKVL
ncbi:MAG: S46 family peptidase [Bacteroidales bacterium]|nr:S46 family peptidase [Bacteroidales bacterium]